MLGGVCWLLAPLLRPHYIKNGTSSSERCHETDASSKNQATLSGTVLRTIPSRDIDTILKLQLLVAWAGESQRLGWWNTNLIDPDGGLDLLTRLAPRTGVVAAWELVRLAAATVDAERRRQHANGDRLVTLFHLGPDVDEAVADRLRTIKAAEESLGSLVPEEPFDRASLTALLASGGPVETEATPMGRRVRSDLPVGPAVRASRLAGALLPLADAYPMPYWVSPV